MIYHGKLALNATGEVLRALAAGEPPMVHGPEAEGDGAMVPCLVAWGEDLKAQTTVDAEIAAERARQDEQWGGPNHDDRHDQMDWMDFITQQVEKFAKNVIVRGHGYLDTPDARQRFVKIGALAQAALESMNRKAGGAQ